jgi:hypothetical protein
MKKVGSMAGIKRESRQQLFQGKFVGMKFLPRLPDYENLLQSLQRFEHLPLVIFETVTLAFDFNSEHSAVDLKKQVWIAGVSDIEDFAPLLARRDATLL